ncbi:MAG TPA: nuclear transport factor 2 family protein [Rhodanobacter sp.]|nr:nuclear transport factor 2 family protein [Rhodanobacter sp.]
MKKTGLYAWLLLAAFAFTVAARAAVPVPADAHAQIEQVVAKFQAALVAKDKAGLESLFMPEGGSWFEVLGDNAYRKLSAQHPQVPRFHGDNHQRFIDFVVGSKGRVEEKFSNVRIETDGAIASVYFDFLFFADGKLNNRGHEAWQLVNTGTGWRISAMAYSSEPTQLR